MTVSVSIKMSPKQAGALYMKHETLLERARKASDLISRYGGIDGDHHKQWVLDQVARILEGENYSEWVKEQKAGEHGPDTYEWSEGTAP